MAKIINLTIKYRENLEQALKKLEPDFIDYRVLSKSLDARNAPNGSIPKYHYKLEVIYENEIFSIQNEKFVDLGALKLKPIIIGAGPAGLFCALRLLEYGIPSIIIERGQRSSVRMKSIAKFWRYGELDPESNVCFGEGGAGLFSDGKLITRIKSPFVNYVMKKLVEFGAPKEIVYYSNPHLGSNKIRTLITYISDYLISGGCEMHFNSKFVNLIVKNNKVEGVKYSKDEKSIVLASENVVLAIGHSAKDTYSNLSHDLNFSAKDFSVGVRVEHPRKSFDKLQYGKFTDDNTLGASKYRLSYHDKEKNLGTYSFCMCPGGHVLSSGTDADGIVTNGMSNFKRNSPWSNAAIVVEVKKGVHFEDNFNSAIEFQKSIEQKAFNLSVSKASGKEMPAQRLKDFCDGKLSKSLPKTSCPSGIFSQSMDEIFPKYITNQLQTSFLKFDRKIKGFIQNDALLIAPETRTSSPIRMERDRVSFESDKVEGVYPCGEGAGFAGGITSAAVDGVNCAMSIIEKEKDFKIT